MERNQVLSESEKIELLSEDIQEILGQTPRWVVRWGITLIFLVLLTILASSFIFKYPDVISGSVIIVSENPPVPIIAQSTGKIEEIFVKDQQQVKSNCYLAILENTANHIQIFDLKEKLKKIKLKFDQNTYSSITELTCSYSLGPVQSSFSNFQHLYNEFAHYLAIDIIEKKIMALNKQEFDYKEYAKRLNLQASNLQEYLNLQYNQYRRDSLLYINNIIALMDFERSEQAYIEVKNNYQTVFATIASTNMQINQLLFQKIDLQNQLMEQTSSRIASLIEALNNLRNSIAEWEKNYVLISPIEGKITFVNFWSQNQYVMSGNLVFTIIPSKPRKIIGKIKFSVTGSGKVEKGQKVLVRLDNFPYNEFGMIEGEVSAISLIPEVKEQNSYYTAEILFKKGLTTNYGRVLPLNQQMTGSGEIITKNLSVFERLINPFKSAIKKSI